MHLIRPRAAMKLALDDRKQGIQALVSSLSGPEGQRCDEHAAAFLDLGKTVHLHKDARIVVGLEYSSERRRVHVVRSLLGDVRELHPAAYAFGPQLTFHRSVVLPAYAVVDEVDRDIRQVHLADRGELHQPQNSPPISRGIRENPPVRTGRREKRGFSRIPTQQGAATVASSEMRLLRRIW